MSQKNLKSFVVIVFIFSVLNLFAQKKPYEIPTLDSEKVFNAKLSPDPENKEVISSYLKGKTTKDTLRIKIKGTYMVQNVTITVLCLDKQENIHVEIAKGQWKKIERKGKTKNGIYKISFKTARDFGIAIHNNKIGTPFNVIIWTSGELKPKDNNLFIPINEYNKKHNTSFNDTKQESIIKKSTKKNNFTMYIIAGALILIVILLFMLLKKKKNKTLGLFILLFTFSNIIFSQITTAQHTNVMNHLNTLTSTVTTSVGLTDAENANLLSEEDRNHEPNVNPDGQPELPSSCDNAGNKNRPNDDGKNKPRNIRTNTNGTSTEDEDNKYDDIDKPKYDEDGNAIEYGENTTTTNNNDPFTDDGVVVQGDGLKKDEDGNIIPGSGPTGQIMDDEAVVIHNIEHPKYDKDGKVIQYDTSDRPRHDADGVPINYPIENGETNYNREGRPKYDKDGKPIIYDDVENPRYDKNGSVIKYKETTDENLEGAPESTNTDKNGNVRDSETAYDDKGDENMRNNTNQNQTGNKTESTNNNVQNDDENQDNSDGCKCLKKAYDNLEVTRYNFEKLRIIYNRQEKITKYAISFGDDVSPLTGGLGGLAWQKERFKILKQMEKFYKAYDNKHLYYVDKLKTDLKEIEKCEAQLDFDNWYSRVGFLYYNFMKDKYKRQ